MRREWIVLGLGVAWLAGAGLARGDDARAKPAATTGSATTPAPSKPGGGATASLYVPPAPSSRLEGGRVGGGTRSARPSACDTRISVVAPAEHAGLTAEAQPTLYFLLSKDTGCSLVFVLNDRRQVPPLVEAPLEIPARAGLHAIRLADLGGTLETDVEYDWFVRVKDGGTAGTADPYSGGQIRRVAAPDGMAEELSKAGARKAAVLGHHSLWYDTVAELSLEIDASPADATLRSQRAALFEGEGLANPDRLTPPAGGE